MDKHKAPVIINYDNCPPCSGLVCEGVCPQGVLETGDKGKPVVSDPVSCTQCGVCADLCPTKAITVTSSQEVEET